MDQKSGTERAAEAAARSAIGEGGDMNAMIDDMFSAYLERHRAAALAVATRMLRDADQAEDIVQEAASRMYRDGMPAGEGEFHNLLMHGVRRLAKNFNARKRRWEMRRHALAQVVTAAVLPVTAVEERELQRIDARTAARALACLPRMQRACFTGIILEGHSSEEVARIHGINGVTARQHSARARKALAKRLGRISLGVWIPCL